MQYFCYGISNNLVINLIIYKDKPYFDDQCEHALGLKQEAHIRWIRDRYRFNWEEFVCVRCPVRANEIYSEAKCQKHECSYECLSLFISGGPLLSLLCSAWVRHCHRILVWLVDWCECRSVRLICCQIILTASSTGSLSICRLLVMRILDL